MYLEMVCYKNISYILDRIIFSVFLHIITHNELNIIFFKADEWNNNRTYSRNI